MNHAGRVLSLSLCAVAVAPLLAAGRSPQDQLPQAKTRDLRVMSYNIKHGQTNASCTQPPRIPGQDPFPDCNLDLQASIVMRAHDADIIGVQEVSEVGIGRTGRGGGGGNDSPAGPCRG